MVGGTGEQGLPGAPESHGDIISLLLSQNAAIEKEPDRDVSMILPESHVFGYVIPLCLGLAPVPNPSLFFPYSLSPLD